MLLGFSREINLMKETNNRIIWIDIAKGIGIMCTILGHQDVAHLAFYYSFHMPLFFILTGYTIKEIDKSKLIHEAIKDFKRLIIPCFITSIITILIGVIYYDYPIVSAIKDMEYRLLWGNGLPYYEYNGIEYYGIYSLWFLICLFWAKTIYHFLQICINKKYRMIFACFGALFSYLIFDGTVKFQNMDIVFLSIVFIAIGEYLNGLELDDYKYSLFGVIAFGIWVYQVLNHGVIISLSDRIISVESIIVAIMGTVSIIEFSKSIEHIVISKVFRFLGENSLDLVCIHFIFQYFGWVIQSTHVAVIIRTSLINIVVLLCWVFVKKSIKMIFAKVNISF